MNTVFAPKNNPNEKFFLNLTFYSLIALSLFLFTSIAASALSHILLIPPALYFIYKVFKNRNSQPLDWSWSQIGLASYIVICLLSLLFQPELDHRWNAMTKTKYMLVGLLGVLPYREAFARHITQKQIKLLLILFILTTSAANISGIIGVFTGHNPLRFKPNIEAFRSQGMYGMTITYGYGIQFVALALTGVAFHWKKFKPYFYGPILLLGLISSLAGLYYSFSRGAALGYLAGLPFLFWHTSKKTFFLLCGGGALLLASLLVVVFTGHSTNRMLLTAKADTNMMRISQYKTAWYAFLEKPLLGHGFRKFEPQVARIKEKHNIEFPDFHSHAHNNYLEALAATGGLGLMALLFFLFHWIKEISLRKDLIGLLLPGFMAAFLLSGLFQNTFTDGENMFLIMFAYSISQVKKGTSR